MTLENHNFKSKEFGFVFTDFHLQCFNGLCFLYFDCLDCFAVCPEPQVIRESLKGAGSPVISSPQCTNCGRCIDVCSEQVFKFGSRFNKKVEAKS